MVFIIKVTITEGSSNGGEGLKRTAWPLGSPEPPFITASLGSHRGVAHHLLGLPQLKGGKRMPIQLLDTGAPRGKSFILMIQKWTHVGLRIEKKFLQEARGKPRIEKAKECFIGQKSLLKPKQSYLRKSTHSGEKQRKEIYSH